MPECKTFLLDAYDKYIKAFIEKQGFLNNEYNFIEDKVVEICDWIINIDDIIYDIDHACPVDKLFDYLEYCTVLNEFYIPTPTYKDYIDGKVIPQEGLDKLASIKNSLDKAIEEYKETYLKQ